MKIYTNEEILAVIPQNYYATIDVHNYLDIKIRTLDTDHLQTISFYLDDGVINIEDVNGVITIETRRVRLVISKQFILFSTL